MAPRDHTTDADTHDGGGDDWFEDPAVAESISTTGPSETSPGRRLTVLTEQKEPATSDTDDDWFIDDRGADPAPISAAEWDSAPDIAAPHDSDLYESFDARTTVLRNQRPHNAPPPAASSWWRRHRGAVAVTTAIAVLGGSALGVGVLLTGVSDEPAAPTAMSLDEIVTTTAAPTSTAPAAAGAAAADVTWCTGQGEGKPVTGDSDDPGAAAIWRFEKAFYFDRDGGAARAAGTPDAVMASAQRLQVGIDQLEPDIEFCVLADTVDAGIYNVTVLERGLGIDGRMTRQRMTTTTAQDGQTLITAIVPR